MSARKRPEKAVPMLVGRLMKAKDHALQVVNGDETQELGSKFDDIVSDLNLMTNSLSKIKTWEKKVVEQLCVLEQVIDDEIFSFKDPEMEPQVHDKLELMQDDITKLKSLISTVNRSVTLKLGRMSFKPKDLPREEDDHQTLSQEWTDLGVENKILESDAMSSLSASFHCLESTHIKMCLLCLSIFPENTPIKKRPLIYWWMGEGLVAKSRTATAEEVGEQVFQELLNEGFIKPSSSSKSFIVYPSIRRMLILLAQKSGFIKFDPQGAPCNGKRRAFLWRGSESYATNEGEREEDLLTVFNLNEQYLGSRPDWLLRRHKVEVLQMGRWQDSATHHIEAENYEELFKGLGSQKHLRYLSLRGISRIETLPRSIRKLVSLQILDLRACHNLEKLPQSITELNNLTHLDVSECYLLETMPKGLEHLSNLQVVKGFVVATPGKNSCKIGDMARLQQLRKLSLRVRNEQLGSLVNFEALRILTISWGVAPSPTVLSLPTTLTKLDLRSVPFETVPEWLQPSRLPNLEKLYIKGGKLNNLNRHDYRNVKFLRLHYLQIHQQD